VRAAAIVLVGAIACVAHAPAKPAPELAQTRAQVARIELCKTTAAEVRAMFGEPVRDGRQGRLRIQDWLVGEHPERVLAIVLDDHDVVVDLTFDTPGGATWIPASQCGAAPAP
jgi:hypothetical protein